MRAVHLLAERFNELFSGIGGLTCGGGGPAALLLQPLLLLRPLCALFTCRLEGNVLLRTSFSVSSSLLSSQRPQFTMKLLVD